MYGNGLLLNRVAISGSNGPRASLFAPAAKEVFGLGMPAPSPRRFLGQTAQDYYGRAKTELSRYDSLVNRVAKLANKADRDRIIDAYGLTDPNNKDKSGYMRVALASDVANADKFQPTAYEEGFPTHGPARGRVDKLKGFSNDLEGEVQTSEQTYGILPEPVVIERVVTVPGQGGTNVVPYVVVGGIAVVALAALGVFG